MNTPQNKHTYAQEGNCRYESKRKQAIANTFHADPDSPFATSYTYSDITESRGERDFGPPGRTRSS